MPRGAPLAWCAPLHNLPLLLMSPRMIPPGIHQHHMYPIPTFPVGRAAYSQSLMEAARSAIIRRGRVFVINSGGSGVSPKE